jgi:peptide/nickel transport system substrate-binding protein
VSTTSHGLFRRLLAFAAVVAVLAAGCSSGGGGGNGSGGSNGGKPTAEGDIDSNGVVRVGYDLVLQAAGGFQLDPAEQATSANEAVLYLVYGRLMRPTEDGGLEPDLAESASVVDANTIEIVLRDGVTFQDGTPFDAAAVQAGLERSLAAENEPGFTPDFFSLESVEVVAPDTVRLTISDGTALSWFDTFLGSWQTTIVKPDTDFSRPVGAGPFKVEAFEPEQSLVLTRYSDYWDVSSITVGGMEFTHIAADQMQSGISALRAGQIDLSITDATQLAGLSGNLEPLIIEDGDQTVAMQVCKQDGPLADPDVRRAINKAIDREAISEAIYQGTAAPATQIWPEGHRFFDPALAEELAYDQDAARELLEEAGYADGFSFDLYLVPALGLPDVAQVIQQQLAEVGVTIDIIPAANYVNDFLTPKKAGAGLIPGSAEGLEKLNQWVGDALANACQYSDPELDAVAEQLALVSQSSEEAVELWRQVNETVVSDALGIFVLFRSGLAAYDSDRLVEVGTWPKGSVVVPDPRATTVRAGS